jgi:hypothetical protein
MSTGRDAAGLRSGAAGSAAVAFTALLVSVTIAPIALAGFRSGTYEGTTSQETVIRFTATKQVVKRFSYGVMIQCADGIHTSEWGAAAHKRSAKAPISDKGRFNAVFESADGGVTSVVVGRLKRGRGSGTIETEGTVPGVGECASSVEWSAHRQPRGGG